MHLELIAREPFAIQLHLATIVPAFFLGTSLIFFSKKGSPKHRVLGFTYLLLMTVTAIAAIFVQSLRPGHFTWVHLFVPITLWGVVAAIWRIRVGDVKGHKQAMLGTYFGGLIIAGAFTFAPGRLMHSLFFGTR
jgi:uncharacterized membrane protein